MISSKRTLTARNNETVTKNHEPEDKNDFGERADPAFERSHLPMVVLYDADRAKIDRVLADLKNEIEQFSQYGENTEISYAQGWALSTEYAHFTLRSLFDKADQFMYENKQRSKMGRRD